MSVCLPDAFVESLGFEGIQRSRQKAAEVRLYLSLCSSTKALCWYWLKQCLFVLCQQFPQLVVSWEETATQRKEGKTWWLNAGDRASKVWAPLPTSQSGKHAASLPRPHAWRRVIMWPSMVPASLAVCPNYSLLATSTAASSSLLWHLARRGPRRRGWPARCPGVNQGRKPIAPHL